MNRQITYLICICASLLPSCDTEKNIEPRYNSYFVKYYGGQGSQTGRQVKETSDGGYIIVGTDDHAPQSTGTKDILLVKVDAIGNQQWIKTYDGLTNADDEGMSVIEVNGGYVVAGNTNVGSGAEKILLTKVDQFGEIISEIELGEAGYSTTCSNISLGLSGILVTGATTKTLTDDLTNNLDIYYSRVELDLSSHVSKVFGGQREDFGIKAFEDNLGQLVIFGNSDNKAAEKDGFLISHIFTTVIEDTILSTGGVNYAGSLGTNEYCYDVTETNFGYAAIGHTFDEASSKYNLFIAQVAFIDGSYQNIRAYPILDDNNIEGTGIAASQDGGYIIAGKITKSGNTNIYLAITDHLGAIKKDNTGTFNVTRTFGDSFDDGDGYVLQGIDGSILLTGTINLESQTKIVLIKTGPNLEMSNSEM